MAVPTRQAYSRILGTTLRLCRQAVVPAVSGFARSRHLLACGVLAAASWGVSVYALRSGPIPVQIPSAAPTQFAEWVGSPEVRVGTLASLLSQLLSVFAAFGVVLAVGRGPGMRRAFWGALLLGFGHSVGIASSGVALFVYPRVATLVSEGRLEVVDVVGVMPMGGVILHILPVVAGICFQALGIWHSVGAPRVAGWLVAVGVVGSLVGTGGGTLPGAWVGALVAWLAGSVWLVWAAKPNDPGQNTVGGASDWPTDSPESLDSLKDKRGE